MRAEKEVTLKLEPRGRRPRSSKRVMPWKATFSVIMLMSGKPLSCRHHVALITTPITNHNISHAHPHCTSKELKCATLGRILQFSGSH